MSTQAAPLRPLRAAVIGLGVGEKLAEAVRAHPHADLHALCDFDPGKRAAVATRFPGVPVSADADALLDDPAVDLVCIASHDNFHCAQTLRALAAGKHVFVEKPFVLDEDEALQVRDALAHHPGLRLSSNLILRRCPRFLDLRQRIRAGELGQLFHLEGDYNYGRLHKILQGWRGRMPNYSAVHGGGVHIADLLMWLAGERVVEVQAWGNAIASAGSGFRNFDLVMALLRFESGAVGKLGVNFGCVFPHFHKLELYGTGGTFSNGMDHALLYRSRDPAQAPERLTTAYPGTHKGELLANFIDSLQGRAAAEVTEADVFDSLGVCLAIERSVHSGQPVRVDYLWEGPL